MSSVPETRNHRGLNESVHRPLSKMDALYEANRCLYCYDAPCTKACPTHIDVPSFIQKIATGNLLGSAKVIMESNPIGASCARVCPTEELCEGACVLGKDTSPIRIGDLQRYSTDWARENEAPLFNPGAPTGKRVAVVGGGPAGLSAARELARFGHHVTIYEAKEELGGLNTYGIVPFRLDAQTAHWEVEQVTCLGVDVQSNTQVGRDVLAEDIVREHDAVVLAVGMGGVPALGVSGEDLEGVYDAIDFIERVKTGCDVGPLGSHVAVIGAGNTAIDAATCSVRLGAPLVTMYYRRTEREMTAYEFEYDFAKQEGVEFRFLTAPVEIVGEAGRVVGVRFQKTELVTIDGKATARGIPESSQIEPVTSVILAIGQNRHEELFKQFSLELKSGVPVLDDSMQTSREGVFAAGDCVFSKGKTDAMVVVAAEQGKRAARSVHQFLTGQTVN